MKDRVNRRWLARAAALMMLSLPLGGGAPEAAANEAPRKSKPIRATIMKPDVSYQAATFAELPLWEADNHALALGAFVNSCDRLLKSKTGGVLSAAFSGTEASLLATCDDARRLTGGKPSAAAAREFFEIHFVPHRVVHPAGEGLLTGYYEPVIEGSRVPGPAFKAPVYRRPADLVNLVDESQRGAAGAAFTHARLTDKGTVPYPTRAEIDQGALAGKGLELLYLRDEVDLFFMQVQGSGRIRFPDGSFMRVTYDGKNGHPYTSIGRYLIDNGLMEKDKASLDSVKRWLKADRARGQPVMWQNASYVFFRELPQQEADGPLGVDRIPLSTGRSLAVDAGFHRIGLPVYVSSSALKHATPKGGFHRLMVAQDVGSAIKGPERGDIFFGAGEEAGRLAGITKHPGNFFVLLPAGAARPELEAGNPEIRRTRAAQQ